MLCSLLAPVDYSEELDDSPVVEFTGGSQQQIGAFNGSIPYPGDLHTTTQSLDWASCRMNTGQTNSLNPPNIQDFSILDNGSFLVLGTFTSTDAGILLSGDQFQQYDSTLMEFNPNGTCTSAITFTHLAGPTSSTMVSRMNDGYHGPGPHSLFVLDDDYLIIGGTLGSFGSADLTYASFANTINKTSERGEYVFLAKFERSSSRIIDYIIFETSGNPNPIGYGLKVGIYPQTFTNSTEIAFAINIYAYYGQGNTGGQIDINGTTYTAVVSGASRSTNVLVRMTHNFSIIESNEIPSPSLTDGHISFLDSGVVTILTGEAGLGWNLQYLFPGQQQWSSVESGCYMTTTSATKPRYLMPLDAESVAWPCIKGTGLSSPVAKLIISRLNVTTGVIHEHDVGNLTSSHDCQLASGGFAISPNRMLVSLRIAPGGAMPPGNSFTSTNASIYGSNQAIHINLTSNTSRLVPSYLSSFTPISYNEDVQSLRGAGADEIVRPSCELGVSFACIGPSRYLFTIFELDQDDDTHANRIDDFPFDNTQHADSDSDGFGDNQIGNNPDECLYIYGNSTIDVLGCPDNDGDGYSNQGDLFINDATQVFDSDNDGYGDNLTGTFGDACPSTYGESTRDRYGCPDADFDGWSDDNDTFPNESSQWADTDGDGYGDQLIGFQGDACPTAVGNSTEDRYGCPDADGDGWSDDGDDMPSNPTQWKDRDGDGYGDNSTGTMADGFPGDGTQWDDSDGDGHGDNPYGSEGDWFPDDPERWADADRDGVADEDDAFPNDATQWNDTDGDGHGDEIAGNQGDAFPNDPEEWQDSDADDVGNNADAFPFDPSQQTDSDGDGFGDNPLGSGDDKFPDDPSQWSDIDGDGFGDNQTGTDADVFIADPTQHADRDGDGYGDSLSGRLADLFPDNPTQWIDQDADGLGDNLSGIDADPYLFDFDNDGYNDSIDPLPMLASPGDIDNDGCLDEVDAFPLDYRECSDFDGDGEGDYSDTDDDNDGWTDTDEIREDTDPFDASDYPIIAFQLMIPGTTIGLDGWDLIGIFGGVPLFAWILFGFVTRNKRCRKYEDMLKGARTKKELENIALKSEYSLMIRLLGPHQGIRLERLRAELDDALEGEGMPFDEDHTEVVEDEMAEVNITEKNVEFDFDDAPDAPPAAIVAEGMSDGATPNTATPPPTNTMGIVGQDGYEWLQQGGATWYRPANSGLEWVQWIQ